MLTANDWEAPDVEPPDRYDYDPADPVMSITGRDTQHAPCDQAPLAGRRDVLVYQTDPLERDLLLIGPLRCLLWASTDALDTDFAVKLVEVGRDGLAINLSFGIVRARYRNSTRKAEPIVPGKIYRYSIDLWATSNLFKKGHQVRLYISSSNFPRFNRNLNTGERTLNSTAMVTARQTIYHDAEHPSAVVLPVIPR